MTGSAIAGGQAPLSALDITDAYSRQVLKDLHREHALVVIAVCRNLENKGELPFDHPYGTHTCGICNMHEYEHVNGSCLLRLTKFQIEYLRKPGKKRRGKSR